MEGCNGADTDVVFLLDASGSVRKDNFQLMLEFVGGVVESLDIDSGRIRVGLITFSDHVYRQFTLNKYSTRADILEAIGEVPYASSTTDTAAALRYLWDNMFTPAGGSRSHARKLGVLMTDGDSDDSEATEREAALVHEEGIHMIVLAIGKWTDTFELQAIASFPQDKNLMEVENFSSLEDTTNIIINVACDSK